MILLHADPSAVPLRVAVTYRFWLEELESGRGWPLRDGRWSTTRPAGLWPLVWRLEA